MACVPYDAISDLFRDLYDEIAMKTTAALAAAALIALAGCSHSNYRVTADNTADWPAGYVPPPREPPAIFQTAEDGKRPANYRKVADARIASILKDPDSRKVRFGAMPYGGLVCGTVNAKNSYGGYVGDQPFYAVFDRSKELQTLMLFTDDEYTTFRQSKDPGDVGYEYHKLLKDCGFYRS